MIRAATLLALVAPLASGACSSSSHVASTTPTAGAAPTAPWLPLDVHDTGHSFVTGRVNGTEVPMLVDTGAGATVIDTALAERLGLVLEGSVTALGTAGSAPARFAPNVTIELGASRFGPMRVVVIDLAPVAARLGRELPVVLGHEIFESAVVELDYPRGRVAFHGANRAAEAPDAHVLELFEISGNRYAVDLQVEGRPAVRVQLDTGSGGMLALFAHYARSEGLLEGRSKVTTCRSGGVGGFAVARLATLDSISIGGIELRGVPTTFDQSARGASAARDLSGNLGAGILRRFRVTVDAPHGRLVLVPGDAWDRPFDKNRLGLDVVRQEGAFEVQHVAAGSPAEHAGWRIGERITAIDGRALGADGWRAWRELARAASGTVVMLRDGEGRERQVTLAEYY